MLESIIVYFSPLAPTKILAYVGLGLAYHMTIVYTNTVGQSFGVSSGPSVQSTQQTPLNALRALYDLAANRPSDFGTLIAAPHNDTAFIKGRPNDYYTQNYMGQEFPHVVVARGRDLSAQWKVIVMTYAAVGRMRLTYSPTSQNSNSMAGEALRRAHIPITYSVSTKFTPAVFTHLPMSKCEMMKDCPKKK